MQTTRPLGMPVSWQAIALRGIAAVAFGILTLVWPGITVWVLVVLWGAFALVDGAALLVAAVRDDPAIAGHRGLFAFQGVVGVAAGVVTFVWPDITALALLFVIAAWAFVTGIAAIVMGFRIRHAARGEWLLILTSALGVLFAVGLVITPGAGALVITWLIAWFALVWGVMLLMLAWRVRQMTTSGRGTSRIGRAAPASP